MLDLSDDSLIANWTPTSQRMIPPITPILLLGLIFPHYYMIRTLCIFPILAQFLHFINLAYTAIIAIRIERQCPNLHNPRPQINSHHVILVTLARSFDDTLTTVLAPFLTN